MKLTPETVQFIRLEHDKNKKSVQEIRANLIKNNLYVSEPTICGILKNTKHYDHDYISTFDNKRRLNKDIVDWIRSDENDGLKIRIIKEKIKNKYGIDVNFKTVEQIVKNKLWFNLKKHIK